MTAPAGFLDFFVLEASEYIEQLDALMLSASGSGPDLESLQRAARALRGSAMMANLPSFAEVLEATEHAAHPLERGEAQISPERLAVLGAAATVLRGIAAAMRIGSTLDPASPEIARFAASLDAMQEKETEGERVVPI